MTIPGYLDLLPDAPKPSWPMDKGWWATRKWIKARKRLEYELFSNGGMWSSVQWNIVKAENDVLGVYKKRGWRAFREASQSGYWT